MRRAAESTVAERLEKAWKEFRLENSTGTRSDFGQSALFRSASQAIALPRLTEPVTGVVVETFLHSFPPEDLKGRLLEFLDRHPVDPFWHAPQDAVRPDGSVQPMDQNTISWLLKNQSNKKLKISALDKGSKEKMAWRWLIISHNHANPTNRVKLPPQLSIRYERRGKLTLVAPKPVAPVVDDYSKTLLEEFRKVITSTLKPQDEAAGTSGDPTNTAPSTTDETVQKVQVGQFLEQTFQLLSSMSHGYAEYKKEDLAFSSKPGVSKSVENSLNSWCITADCLLNSKPLPEVVLPEAGALHARLPHVTCVQCGKTVQLDELFDSPGEREEWLTQHVAAGVPYSCGCTETSSSPSPSDESPEEPLETFQDPEGRTWVREDIDFFSEKDGQVLYTMTKGGVNYLAKPDSAPPDVKGKGKAVEKTNPTAKKPEATPPEKSPAGPSGSQKKGGQPDKSSSPLTEENPLKVKGEPASRALSDDQRSSLRKFFKLKEGLIPSAEWSTMDPKQRASALRERSIPRWATAAVLKRPENLEAVLKGSLTKENATEALAITPGKQTKAHGQAIEAWTSLKQDFRGVTLYREPVTSKERAFKKRFDQLVADYGEQKAFPRPKERPDRQGRTASPLGRGSQVAGFEGFLQMAKAIAEVAKAFK